MNTDKIRENLNYGLNLIDEKTLDRLQSARSGALAHYKARKPAWSVALAGHGFYHPHPKVGVWLPATALVLGICAIICWGTINDVQNNDPNDDDAALLADDLPVPAYTDPKLFDSWLNRSQQ